MPRRLLASVALAAAAVLGDVLGHRRGGPVFGPALLLLHPIHY